VKSFPLFPYELAPDFGKLRYLKIQWRNSLRLGIFFIKRNQLNI
jgi:hypothetical protein